MAEYKKLFTNIGLTKQAEALYNGDDFEVASIVIGDGAGSLYEPTPEQTSLLNQRDVLSITEHNESENVHQFFAVIPSTTESYTIREIGLTDSNGNLLWVSQFEMPTISDIENIVSENIIGVQITVTDGTTVVLADGNIQMASKEYVKNLVDDVKENYQRLSEKSQPNGYVPLDNNALVPFENLPAVITNCVADGKVDANGNLDLIDADVASETVIEKKQAGTYTFEIETAGTYSIALVGGGAGGGGFPTGIGNYVNNKGGGSGAGFVGDVTLEAGTYTVVVGKGGNWGGGSGGDSKLTLSGVDLIVAGGGKCPSKGTLTIDENIISGTPTVQADGNNGQTSTTVGYSKVNGGASVYGGYGAGGHSINASGGTGYFKITLSTASSTIVEYNVSVANPLTIITQKGEKQTIDGVNPDDVTSLADGTYHKFIDENGSELLKNSIVYNPLSLTSLSNGDVVIYNGDPQKVYKIVSGELVEYDKVLIATFTMSSGAITKTENVVKYFNNNIFNNGNGKSAYVIDTYSNGTSWYRVYSDGWCEQGGKISVPSTQTTTEVSLLKNYANTNYSVQATNNVTTLHWDQSVDLQISGQTTSKFYISANVPNNIVNWETRGKI